MTRHVLRDLLPVVAVATGFVIAWKVLVVIGGYPIFILPPPEVVAARLVAAWRDGTIEPHVATTLSEILLGFLIGSGLALVIGYALARSRLAERLLSPYLVAAQATPILALAPLIALWFGTGLASKVIICSLIVFFPITVATMVGVRSVDRQLLEVGRAFRATPLQVLTRLEIPGALPAIFGGIRVGATLAVIGAIIGEWRIRARRPDQPGARQPVRHAAPVRDARHYRRARRGALLVDPAGRASAGRRAWLRSP